MVLWRTDSVINQWTSVQEVEEITSSDCKTAELGRTDVVKAMLSSPTTGVGVGLDHIVVDTLLPQTEEERSNKLVCAMEGSTKGSEKLTCLMVSSVVCPVIVSLRASKPDRSLEDSSSIQVVLSVGRGSSRPNTAVSM